MAWPNDMPNDESYVRQMVEDMHSAVQSIDRLLRGYNGKDGLLTDLSHIRRTTRENREAIDKLRATVDALVRGRPDSELSRTRWRVIGEIVVALSAGLALALQFIGG